MAVIIDVYPRVVVRIKLVNTYNVCYSVHAHCYNIVVIERRNLSIFLSFIYLFIFNIQVVKAKKEPISEEGREMVHAEVQRRKGIGIFEVLQLVQNG